MYLPVYKGYHSYWFWGLMDIDRLEFNIQRIDILITGIIIGLIILVCGIKLVFSANSVRIDKFSFEDQKKTWIIAPSLAILCGIIWFVYISYFGDNYFVPSGYDVWDYFYMDLGLIGAFSGGTLTILGYLYHRIIRDTNVMSFFVTDFEPKPKKELIMPYKKLSSPEIQRVSHLELPNFCPKCGLKTGENFKFCPRCGFKF